MQRRRIYSNQLPRPPARRAALLVAHIGARAVNPPARRRQLGAVGDVKALAVRGVVEQPEAPRLGGAHQARGERNWSAGGDGRREPAARCSRGGRGSRTTVARRTSWRSIAPLGKCVASSVHATGAPAQPGAAKGGGACGAVGPQLAAGGEHQFSHLWLWSSSPLAQQLLHRAAARRPPAARRAGRREARRAVGRRVRVAHRRRQRRRRRRRPAASAANAGRAPGRAAHRPQLAAGPRRRVQQGHGRAPHDVGVGDEQIEAAETAATRAGCAPTSRL